MDSVGEEVCSDFVILYEFMLSGGLCTKCGLVGTRFTDQMYPERWWCSVSLARVWARCLRDARCARFARRARCARLARCARYARLARCAICAMGNYFLEGSHFLLCIEVEDTLKDGIHPRPTPHSTSDRSMLAETSFAIVRLVQYTH